MTAKPMLDCNSVMRQLWDYLDDELTDDRMEAIREHLKVCARCQPHVKFDEAFLAALTRVRREHSDPARVSRQVRAALKARGYTVEA